MISVFFSTQVLPGVLALQRDRSGPVLTAAGPTPCG